MNKYKQAFYNVIIPLYEFKNIFIFLFIYNFHVFMSKINKIYLKNLENGRE